MTAGIARQPDTRALNEIVRFVLARLDDDYRALRQLMKQGIHGEGLHSSRRRLVEIDANREIVGVVQRLAVLRDLPAEQPVRDHAMHVLRSMAMPYAEHRDYHIEWCD